MQGPRGPTRNKTCPPATSLNTNFTRAPKNARHINFRISDKIPHPFLISPMHATSRDSLIRRTTGRTAADSRQFFIFQGAQTGSGAHPVPPPLVQIISGIFGREQSGRWEKQSAHFNPFPMLYIPPLLPHAFTKAAQQS